MPSRRGFLAGLAATGLAPAASWAEAGNPTFLAAAQLSDETYWLFGLSDTGAEVFRLPLPGRGHAASAHPTRPEAVAFARRPGRFALVIDCANGREVARLTAPDGRHFYGHGTFSADGTLLFTSENDYEAARGVIGVWDRAAGYARIDEFASGGIGPHDILLMPDGQTLAVANGGIETHPEAGRTKLNIPTMAPNLAFLSLSGHLQDKVELPSDMHKNSIRHLAVSDAGDLAFTLQWQDEGLSPPLLGVVQVGGAPRLMQAPVEQHRRMQGYGGSVAISPDGRMAAVTSPRGGVMQVFDTAEGNLLDQIEAQDICGVSFAATDMIATTGTGQVLRLGVDGRVSAKHECAWDNHLIAIG
ncbi:DUF1513 domain-containing protein [Halovulum sp. GXIMD14793]